MLYVKIMNEIKSNLGFYNELDGNTQSKQDKEYMKTLVVSHNYRFKCPAKDKNRCPICSSVKFYFSILEHISGTECNNKKCNICKQKIYRPYGTDKNITNVVFLIYRLLLSEKQ